jgi:hypothetical protein
LWKRFMEKERKSFEENEAFSWKVVFSLEKIGRLLMPW